MKVSKLISELKKMPQSMRVGVSMGDNSEGEVAGWPCSVNIENEVEMGSVGTGCKVVVIPLSWRILAGS